MLATPDDADADTATLAALCSDTLELDYIYLGRPCPFSVASCSLAYLGQCQEAASQPACRGRRRGPTMRDSKPRAEHGRDTDERP